MYKVIYTYTHSADIIEALNFTTAEIQYREEFLTHAYEHGLLHTKTDIVDEHTIMHEAVWESAEARAVAEAQAGVAYQEYTTGIKNRLEAAGATFDEQVTQA